MTGETVFIAKPTPQVLSIYPEYKDFYNHFRPLLERFHKVTALALPDIWVRDFLPLQHIHTGALFQPFFDPRYANYTPAFNAAVRQAVSGYFAAEPCRVRIDGGNLIGGPQEQFFCFARRSICRKEERASAGRELNRATGARRIVWLPKEAGDKICHIDGFMQFLGDVLFVSDERFEPYLKTLLERRLAVVKRACPGIKIRLLPCIPDTADKSGLSARGVYVNFLETSRAVFVPRFNLPQDKAVISIIKTITVKPVVAVDCSVISRYGGAVHCLTKEYV